MKTWAVAIAQDEKGNVYLEMHEGTGENSRRFAGRVPIWDGLPPRLLSGCIEEWAAGLTVNFNGKQTGKHIKKEMGGA